jgi:putative membrane protein
MVSDEDQARIAVAVREVEARSNAQIVCVLARQSCDIGAYAALYAATLALLVPWPLILFTQTSVARIFAVQLILFIIALAVLGWTRLGLMLTPRGLQRRQAYRAAAEQFFIRGLSRTKHRAGVLIYVSLAEHYARIIADEGLDGKITDTDWRPAVDILTSHVSRGQIAEGYVAAIAHCGELLAQAAPPEGRPDALPDGLVQLR